MKEYQSQSHTRWDCKYHVVFIPKKRKKLIFGAIRVHLGEILHELAGQKDCRIVEGHMMPDTCSHVYQHTAEIFSRERGGVYQRKECDFDSPPVHGAQQEFWRGKLLGQRLFCFDGRSGRRNGKSLYPPSGA